MQALRLSFRPTDYRVVPIFVFPQVRKEANTSKDLNDAIVAVRLVRLSRHYLYDTGTTGFMQTRHNDCPPHYLKHSQTVVEDRTFKIRRHTLALGVCCEWILLLNPNFVHQSSSYYSLFNLNGLYVSDSLSKEYRVLDRCFFVLDEFNAHRNSHSIKIRRSSRPLYVLLVVAVILASHLELRSQDALKGMSMAVLQALRLTAIAIMEQGEYNVLQREASRDAGIAKHYEQEAKYLEHRASVDKVYAVRNSKRGHYFEKIALQEQVEADAAMHKIQRDDALRIELLSNLTAEEQQEEALEQQERDGKVNLRLCDAGRFFVTICALIGGAPGLLERHEFDEQRKILQESQALAKVEKREFMDELVASILQGKADNYKQISVDLLHLAVMWDAQANRDAEEATHDSEAAAELFEEVERIGARMQKENDWENENSSAAEELLSEAERDGATAYRYALEAVILALLALLYFLPTTCHKVYALAHTMVQAHIVDKEEIWRSSSYCLQHVLIFMLVTGMIDHDYLLHLNKYDVLKRAVIVVWFAYLAAGLETILLNTLPHCISEHFDRSSLGDISVQFFLHMLTSMAFYIVEFLVVWLTCRDLLFTAESVQSFSSWIVRLVGVLMLATHIAVFEPRGLSLSSPVDEQSTVLMIDSDDEDDKSQATESSPSRGEATSSSPTEDLPLIYFRMRSGERPHATDSSVHGASPYTIDWDKECIKLSIALEVLLIVCAVSIVRNGMALTWSHSMTTTLAILGLFALLLLIFAFFRFMFRQSEALTPPGNWFSGSYSKKLIYTSIDV